MSAEQLQELGNANPEGNPEPNSANDRSHKRADDMHQGAGDSILATLDCSQPFLLLTAAIPQNQQDQMLRRATEVRESRTRATELPVTPDVVLADSTSGIEFKYSRNI